MANSLSAVIPQILAQGLMALRENAIMPALVNTDYGRDARAKGATIDVPIPSAIAAQVVAPGATPPSTADSTPTSVPIALDQWYEAPFYLTDKDIAEAMGGTIPMQVSEAVKALGNNVDNALIGLYTEVYGFGGTAGTTPFGTDTSQATEVRKILNQQLAPKTPRRVVLDPDAEANALDLRAFQDTAWRADADGIREGEIGRKFGFDWFMDQNIGSHTAGSITTGAINKASTAVAVGAKSLVGTTAASTGAVALVVGDIFTIAGDTQTYVVTTAVTEASASTDFTLAFEPGLKVALTGSEAITLKASHVTNLAFHRDAFALAVRPLEVPGDGLGNMIRSAVDPVSGLALRLEVSREHKRTRWSFDILYGVKCVRPELATRLAG